MRSEHGIAGTDPQIVSLTQGLVNYVRELVQSRRKPVRNCDRYPSQVWLADAPDGVDLGSPRDDGVLLVVDYVPRRPYPALPAQLRGWVDADGLDKHDGADPELASRGPALVEVLKDDGSTRLETAIVGRHECPDVGRCYEDWIPRWRRWAKDETVAERHRRLYTNMSRMARKVMQADDVYEVVLGVGLLARDRATAKITVALALDSPARFEDGDFLDADDGYSPERAEPPRAEFSALDPHPLTDDTTRLLDQWSGIALDEGVRFSTSWVREVPDDGALGLSLAPAILLRERDANALVQYYERIAASLSGSGARSPLGLAQLIAPLERAERLAWDDARPDRLSRELEADPLFPLPTSLRDSAVIC